MIVLLDANIWIDIACRPSAYPDSEAVFISLIKKRHEVWFPACSYTSVFYVIHRSAGKSAAAIDFFDQVLAPSNVRIAPFTIDVIRTARSLNFTDHADACVAASAVMSRCEFLVTRDRKGFAKSTVPVVTPTELLSQLETTDTKDSQRRAKGSMN